MLHNASLRPKVRWSRVLAGPVIAAIGVVGISMLPPPETIAPKPRMDPVMAHQLDDLRDRLQLMRETGSLDEAEAKDLELDEPRLLHQYLRSSGCQRVSVTGLYSTRGPSGAKYTSECFRYSWSFRVSKSVRV